ncbi:MAG: cytochrome c3 family protein, partial [Calditrichia bacterium]|nr:cytochrome c3 family protein [Calditrichia bacterium]
MRNMQKYVGFLIGINLILLNFLFSQTQKDVIKFSHKLHLENEVECETCHQNAANSQTGKDNLMPSMESCSDCHDIEEENECGICHSNINEPGEITRIQSYSLLFSHEKHLKSNINCLKCHADINKKEFAGVYHLPAMDKCMNCHTKKTVTNQCNACHAPDEQLRPVSHRGDFMHIHGQSAKTGNMDVSVNMSCSSCHSDNYCQNCHEGENVEKNIHPLNFEFT